MRYEQLRYVLAIVELGSMRKAADALYISQPSLSESISRLEEELGFSLFVRSHNGLSVSKEGEQALPIIKEIVALSSELKNIQFNHSDQCLVSKEYNIQATAYFLNNILLSPLAKFSKFYNNITLNVTGNNSTEICANVAANKCDLGYIASIPSFIRELPYSDCIVEELSELPLYFLVNIQSSLADKKSISLKDISPAHKIGVINFNNKAEAQEHISYQFKGYTVPEISILSTSMELIIERIALDNNTFGIIYTNFPKRYEERYAAKGIKILPVKEKRTMLFASIYHKSKLNDSVFCLALNYLRSHINLK